jgi:hypothetical protein
MVFASMSWRSGGGGMTNNRFNQRHVVKFDELYAVCGLIHVLLDETFDELFIL